METSSQMAAGSLIIVGCGGASEMLPRIGQFMGPVGQVVLIDPVAEAAERLPASLDEIGPTHILAVPGPRAGKAEVILYSLPGLVSLGQPTDALTALFPGLKERDRASVDRVTGKDLAAQLGDLPDPLTCMIDLPGGEAEILDALDAAGLLQRLSVLRVRCGVEPFFDGALASEEIESQLTARGFALRNVTTDDSDWPELHFIADPRARRLAELETEVNSLGTKLSNRDRSLKTARADLQKQSKGIEQRDKEIATLSEQLAARTLEIDQVVGKLSEREAALEATSSELEKKNRELAAKATALETSERELSRATNDLEEASRALAGSLEAQDEVTKKLKGKEHDLAKQKETLEQTSGDLAELKRKLAQKQALLDERNQALADHSAEIVDRDKSLHSARKELDALNRQLKDTSVALETTRAALEAKEATLAERDQSVARASEELSAARHDLTEKTDALAEAQRALAARDEALAEARQATMDQKAALSDAQKALAERDATLAEQKNREEKLQSDLDALQSELNDLSQAAEAGATIRAEMEGQLADRDALVSELQTKVATGEAELAERNDRIADLEARLADTSPALEMAERRAEQATTEQAFQARLNAMLQVDLDNLRTRFDISEGKRRQQEELLRKLTPKLTQASEHLQQLQLAQASETPTIEEEEPSELASKKPHGRKASTKHRRSAAASKQGK